MIPDRLRWPVLLLCLVGIGWLGVASTDFAENRDAGIRAALRDPVGYEGSEVLLMMWWVVSVEGPDHFTATRWNVETAVEGPSEGLEPGDVVSVSGTVHDGGAYVRATEVQHHRWRTAKEALGVVGLLGALVAFPLAFRRRDGWLEERF
ncbi:MAG: hypothetical protein H6742_03545 [Alphaproteobacteria bacterium]|nr:hypothetical protein [Alphaproteobacteria bacterium]